MANNSLLPPKPRRSRSARAFILATFFVLLALGAVLIGISAFITLSAPAGSGGSAAVRHLVFGSPADDGIVAAEGITVFDAGHPAVANLDTALLDALRTAATDAADAGVAVVVTSGWRSPEYQDRLLQDAVALYGSEAEAARWVATADTSAHVHGDAVDVGPYAAIDWLAIHGARYGLCQVYANEAWHFEYLPDAVTSGCPAMYADPTWDPRLNP
ncbi:M15 family metallopeptidase [Arthrobacter sp. Helios]|uniref:M15 family metallopeptidase n=1 Tax=Arthrobacter sp. Helios TaxID=2828862 RepID=UPI0020704706|nr:M15 family metallopeptidase [Arthrobacter sp. Helios]UPO76853.1 M15 family metallopeptidase [Arthrobacter sp. Helios]